MSRIVLALAFLALVSAFAPGVRPARSSALEAKKKAVKKVAQVAGAGGLIGADVDLSLGFWDPAGLAAKADDDTLAWYRTAELKHGRVSMLAVTGFIVQSWTRFGDFDDVPMDAGGQVKAMGALYAEKPGAIYQIIWGIACLEVLGSSIQKYSAPGDLGWDPLGMKPSNPDELERLQLVELKNGRLAMIGVAGMATEEAINGMSIHEHFLSGHYPF
jgi:hypothetical protein